MTTPFYERDGVQIWHGDARDVLPHIGDVDHCITDPPYSEETHKGARTSIDETLVDFASITSTDIRSIFALVGQRLRGWLVATVDWRHVRDLETETPEHLRFVRFGIWVKPNGAPQFTGDRPSTGWEAIAILHREGKKMRWNGGGHNAVYTHNKINGEHRTQKPLPLIEEFVTDFTQPGDTILDPFAGSCTLIEAAWKCGRKAVCIEKSKRWCEYGRNRAERVISQGRLFQPEPVKETQAALFGDPQ